MGFAGVGKVSRFLPLPKSYHAGSCPQPFLYDLLALTILKNCVQKKPWPGFQFRLPCLRISSSPWTSVFPSVKWRPGEQLLQLLTVTALETSASKRCAEPMVGVLHA